MSAAKFGEAGLRAVDQRKWPEAIQNLSKAISQSASPAWLLSRSQAFMETGNLKNALRDAEYAYCTAAERGNDKSRKQMIEAQYRRSVCYFRMKKYADADLCATWSQRLAKGAPVSEAKEIEKESIDENGFYCASAYKAQAEGRTEEGRTEGSESSMSKVSGLISNQRGAYEKDWNKAQAWRCQIVHLLEALPVDDPLRKITTKLVPMKPPLQEQEDEQLQKSQNGLEQGTDITPSVQIPSNTEEVRKEFRSQFYESNPDWITISIFMKFLDEEDTAKVRVDIQTDLITVNGVPRNPPIMYLIPYAPIVPARSTYRVATMKIEFVLAKATIGKWPTLGHEVLSQPDPSTLPKANKTLPDRASSVLPPVSPLSPNSCTAEIKKDVKPRGPVYPTSSRAGPKNWDKVELAEEDEPKDVNSFFQELYKNSTPEQQRAMMKSYTESNGTSLSTDWAQVSKGKVETSPPDGMEAKRWDQ